jgi:hypothetical protein
MNEQIRLLSEQAHRSTADELAHLQRVHNRTYDLNESAAIYNEKFALLIVRECISIVDEQKECLHEEQQYWHDRDYGYALAVDDASKGIKQFFGVEE